MSVPFIFGIPFIHVVLQEYANHWEEKMVKRTFEMDLTGAPLVLETGELLNLQRCGARPLRRDDCLDDGHRFVRTARGD